jgi:hypothetical protein
MRYIMMGRVVLPVLVMLVSIARAQPSPNIAQAEILFRQGKDQMASGKIAEACASFDASQKLAPSVSTRMNQANCREKNGQLATAWGYFLDASREAASVGTPESKQLRAIAAERAQKLESRVSTLKIVIPIERKLSGLEILRDGELLDPATWNAKLPMDGGTYNITARAPGRGDWMRSVVIAPEKDTQVVEIPLLEPRTANTPATAPGPARPPAIGPPPRPANASGTPGTAVAQQPPAPQPTIGPPRAPSTQPQPGSQSDKINQLFAGRRKYAFAAAGASVALFAIGAAFGSAAESKESAAERLCPDPTMPCANAAEANELSKTGHSQATKANVAFGFAALAAIGAGVVWFTAEKPQANRVVVVPQVAPGAAGIAITGGF